MNKFDPTSHNITDEQRAHLKESFPEAFTEQGIDFDRLKTLLGEAVETGPERYSFTWPGKTEAIRAAQASSMGTLVPDKASSVDWDTTGNLYLEGDNLEILKLLQKSYTGKVKMIYIDPPYNTGNDFVYPDKYGEGLKTYLEYTGQIDGEGKKLSTNTETDGRYHSKWLNMMYSRLMLARNLLRDDGVVFISIDDHEVTNLKKISDSIFGEENFIIQLIVQLNPRGRTLDKFFAKTHEYILVYAKNSDTDAIYEITKGEEMLAEYNKEDASGKFRLLELRNRNPVFNRSNRPKLFYPIFVDPTTGNVSLEKDQVYTQEILPLNSKEEEGCWTWGKIKVAENKSRLFARETGQGKWRVFRKDYLYDSDGGLATTKEKGLWVESEINNERGKEVVRELFDGKVYFDFPKSVALIKKCLAVSTRNNDIVMDFFSGSGTTAHAVMELNAEDGGSRQFIASQLQEPTPKDSEARNAGYVNIAQIGKERIKRAAPKIREEFNEKISTRGTTLDMGFKVYRLTPSTFNVWDVKNDDDLQQKLVEATSLIRGDAKEEDVLTELILKSGYGLTEKVEQISLVGKNFFSVSGGQLMISLESGLTPDHVRQVAEKKPVQFVAREHGFAGDDVLTNTAQIMKDKGIDFRVL